MNVAEKLVVLVSGGSRGLGQAIVADFLARGHSVATFSKNSSPYISQLQEQNAHGDRFVWEPVDATETDRVKKFVLSVAERYGRIDVLVNNAAIGNDGLLALMRPADIHQLLAVNVEAVIHLTQACARVMLARQSGTIISISSVASMHGVPGASVYSATKSALDGLTRSLARELGSQGIRVNAVAPGYFESDMVAGLTADQRRRILARTPLQQLATMDDIVSAVRFLASADARFISGQTLVVDGGFSC